MKKSIVLLALALPVLVVTVALGARDADGRGAAAREPQAAAAPELAVASAQSGLAPRRAAPSESEEPAEHGGFFALRPGTRFTHSFRVDLVTRLAQRTAPDEPEQAVEMGMNLRGRMVVTVVATRTEELFLSVALSEVELDTRATALRTDTDALASVAEALESTAFVRMARDGRTLGYRFPSGAVAETRNLWRSLWSAFHAVLPEDAFPGPRAAWSVEEADATGPLRMDYAWAQRPAASGGSGRLTKARHGLTVAATDATGEGELELDCALRWPRRASYTESGRLDAPEAGVRATQDARYAFELVAHDRIDVAADAFDPQAPWAAPSGHDETLASDASDARPSGRELAQDPLPLVQEILALLGTGQRDSRELYEAQLALAELLQADPGQLAALRELFLSGALEGDAAMVVLAAIGMAQGPEVQAFLAEHLAREDAPAEQRVAALQSAFQIAAPTPALMASIRAAQADARNASPVRATAMLALGALSSREDSGEALAYLLEQEDELETVAELIVWLESLGNSGAPAIVERVEPYLAHEDARVRASAVSALRHVVGAEPVALLVQAATHDPAASVRAVAAELLALSDVATALEAVRAILRDDASALVRRRTLQALGARSPRGALAHELLLAAAQGDPDEGVRRLAESLLAG